VEVFETAQGPGAISMCVLHRAISICITQGYVNVCITQGYFNVCITQGYFNVGIACDSLSLESERETLDVGGVECVGQTRPHHCMPSTIMTSSLYAINNHDSSMHSIMLYIRISHGFLHIE
jgi:hypothetical protein